MTENDLQGKVALVTGSSSGIGAATARMLADAGATVVVNSSSSVDAGTALAAELPGASYVRADIADDAQAEALVAATVDRHGRLDILVNNAGTTAVIPHPDLTAATPDVWRRIFGVNVIGTWQVTVAAVPHLKTSGRRLHRERLLPGRSPAGRQLDPLRGVEGRPQPHDRPPGQRPRADDPRSTPSPPVSSTRHGRPTGTTSAPS